MEACVFVARLAQIKASLCSSVTLKSGGQIEALGDDEGEEKMDQTEKGVKKKQ